MKTLKGKFILIIGLVYVIIGSLTFATFYLAADRIIRNFGTKFAVQRSLLEKNKILSVIDREVALALKLADDPVLKRWCENEEDPTLRGLAFEQLESYRKTFREQSYFIAAAKSKRYYVYDTKEQKLDFTLLSEQNPADMWFFETLAKVDSFALNVDYSRILHDIRVWINAVMKDEHGRKIGVGGTGIDITDFIDEIIRSKDQGVSTILIDRTGAIQAHENREYVQHNASVKDEAGKITLYSLMDNEEDRARVSESIDQLTSEKSDVETFFISLEKHRYLAAATYMKGIRWYNVVLVDVSQIIKFIDFLPIIAVIVLSLFSMLVIIAVMLNHVVLKPLAMLTEASRRVSRGEYGISLPVTRQDEIGQLTASFNVMTATILDSTRNLESRVRDRTIELSEANKQLEEAQKQVMDSINYARLIQSSMLPETSLLDERLKDYFILNLPRDILGGDFYYFRNAGENFLLAVIDCSGHGVPGALITMTVNAVLDHIVDRLGADDPARLLGELHFLMRRTLHHDDSNLLIDSGVDIGLCLCLPAQQRVIFAGAGLALYRFDGKELTEIRGDRRRAGYKGSAEGHRYTNHELFAGGDIRLYLTTDGILDQGGGPRGFGLGRQRFMDLVRSCGSLPMTEQAEVYRRKLDAYRGNTPQRDDILFLGFVMKTGEQTNGDA